MKNITDPLIIHWEQHTEDTGPSTTDQEKGVLLRMSDLITMRERLSALRAERLQRDKEIFTLERKIAAAEVLLEEKPSTD